MLNWELLHGPLPWILFVTGAAGLVYLLWGRGRSWWLIRVPVAVLSGIVVAVAVEIVVDQIMGLFNPEGLGAISLVVIGLIVAALVLALIHPTRWVWRWIALLAVIAVALGGSTWVNYSFKYFPDIRAVVGASPQDETDLPAKQDKQINQNNQNKQNKQDDRPKPVATGPISDSWNPPASMPTVGTLSEVDIPGKISGWNTGRKAWVYLPPAAYVDKVPDLPVLMLMPGDPGSPDQWALTIQLNVKMDAFAAAHRGLAPIVVVPDSRGTGIDPECVNSTRVGQVFTYLSRDVPGWIKATVPHATPDMKKWAVGGLSAGGTCGVQLVVNDPATFSTFLDFSGRADIALADRQDAVNRLFDGNQAAYRKVNPADVLEREKFPRAAGFISIGSEDPTNLAFVQDLRALCVKAGMTIEYQVVPGSHDGPGFGNGLIAALPWVSRRFGLTR